MSALSKKPEVLYHFTAEIFLPPILENGIAPPAPVKGDEMDGVPIEALGVWLTVNPNPLNQQWIRGSFFDKSAVRLSIEVPAEFRGNLVEWRTLATATGVSRETYRALDRAGDYGAKHWWVYRGHVEPSFITAVEVHGRPIDRWADRSRLWERRREELGRVRGQLGTLPVDVVLTPDESAEFGGSAHQRGGGQEGGGESGSP